MMERTSFGMQKNLEPASLNKTDAHAEGKPALPKRSPAPKQDTETPISIKGSENTTRLSKDDASSPTSSAKVSSPAENHLPTKSITGTILQLTDI